MIGRIALLALAVVLLLAIIGKLRLPKPPGRPAVQAARKCPECGAYMVGDGPCTTPGCRGA
ncbi:MAG TPA: hypothetical protein VFN28_04550 [Amaricoccus sp.]|jgi:hypothetical protein|nr:hypothetical protein [Amaricoccus sp.]